MAERVGSGPGDRDKATERAGAGRGGAAESVLVVVHDVGEKAAGPLATGVIVEAQLDAFGDSNRFG